MNETILEILRGFSLDLYRPIFPRSLDVGEPLEPRAGNLVTVISGMRRSGKTYRLLQVMEDLIARGVPQDRLLYFNFEDDRLGAVTPATGDAVIEAFWALSPRAAEQGSYLFLDELQEMEDWGSWLRRIVDTTRATIFVTGSSSKMLSENYSTQLRGRSLEYVQYPLGFGEFVRWHEPELDAAGPGWSARERVALERLLGEYLVKGGFPVVQDLPWQRAVPVLQGYARRVVASDVVERHGVGNPRAASLFGTKVLALCGRPLSLRKVTEEIRQTGHAVSRTALADLVGYFEEAFLVHEVDPRTRSTRLGPNHQRKLYPIDHGLARANMPAPTLDQGQILEDAVAVELLRRQGPSRAGAVASYLTETRRHEVDFCAGDALFPQGLQLLQVSWDLTSPRTMERECRSLWEAMAELGVRESTIVFAHGEERLIERDGARIGCVPAWKWLLGH